MTFATALRGKGYRGGSGGRSVRTSGLHVSDNFAIVEVMRKREYLGQLELMVLFALMRPAGDA